MSAERVVTMTRRKPEMMQDVRGVVAIVPRAVQAERQPSNCGHETMRVRKVTPHCPPDVLNGQNPYERIKLLRYVQDVYARPRAGKRYRHLARRSHMLVDPAAPRRLVNEEADPYRIEKRSR